jgi:hypothetical protein
MHRDRCEARRDLLSGPVLGGYRGQQSVARVRRSTAGMQLYAAGRSPFFELHE